MVLDKTKVLSCKPTYWTKIRSKNNQEEIYVQFEITILSQFLCQISTNCALACKVHYEKEDMGLFQWLLSRPGYSKVHLQKFLWTARYYHSIYMVWGLTAFRAIILLVYGHITMINSSAIPKCKMLLCSLILQYECEKMVIDVHNILGFNFWCHSMRNKRWRLTISCTHGGQTTHTILLFWLRSNHMEWWASTSICHTHFHYNFSISTSSISLPIHIYHVKL